MQRKKHISSIPNLFNQWSAILQSCKCFKILKPLLFLLTIFLFHSPNVYSQGEANNWFFGQNGGLSFNTDPPSPLSGGKLTTEEGCASLSNSNGELLFYTDGSTVFNKNHDTLSEGDGLYGHSSSTQSAIICPHPGNSNLFYIITADAIGDEENNGIYYSVVDMSLDNGNGEITEEKNIILNENSLFTEKLTSVKIEGLNGYWVICHEYGNNNFNVYRIDHLGIHTNPIIIPAGSPHSIDGNGYQAIGYLKLSPDATKMACAVYGEDGFVEIFNFNSLTGGIVFEKRLDSFNGPYGIEFSSNSKMLYVSSYDDYKLYQIDIEDNFAQYFLSDNSVSALQIGPNQKIYGSVNYISFLSTIESPNLVYPFCNFIPNSTPISGSCVWGLPTLSLIHI